MFTSQSISKKPREKASAMGLQSPAPQKLVIDWNKYPLYQRDLYICIFFLASAAPVTVLAINPLSRQKGASRNAVTFQKNSLAVFHGTGVNSSVFFLLLCLSVEMNCFVHRGFDYEPQILIFIIKIE